MSNGSRAECLRQGNDILGESPCWVSAERALYWIDAKRPAIHRWQEDLGVSGYWSMSEPLGCLAQAQRGSFILADARGLATWTPTTGELVRLAHPERDRPTNQFNDGKVDRAGRFWIGSMDLSEKEPTGRLYRFDPDLSIQCLDAGFICSNGIGWSPDNRTMYFTDSVVRTIFAYEYEFTSGALGARRIFAKLKEGEGLPDGLTVDAEGFVWSAIWDGWRLIRYAPDGAIDREVRLPVQRPTCCCFGGKDYKTLFITSAGDGLSERRSQSSLAGSLFALRIEVAGMPETPFEGDQRCLDP